MSFFYNLQNIDLGGKRNQSGHVVHVKAIYKACDQATRIIYKENKNNNTDLTRFEAAFGELARLFLPTDLAPRQTLVKNQQGTVSGLACEHVAYAIARREGLNEAFYKRQHNDNKGVFELALFTADKTENIPFYFFNEFYPGFFATLRRVEQRGEITLDMASLANVLATSYSLEEDDLHKGNLGFYVVHKNEKPHVVFFKIDHDLMLADSVMSRCNTRFLNWFHGSDAFQVTARDLIEFPKLTDSQNYYWPTVRHLFDFNYRVAYTEKSETEAFASLASSPEFCKYKWQAFYKHILIPPVLISQSLNKHLDDQTPEERARMALITQSVVARQAKLRAVLFTIPAFREFISSLDKNATHDLVQGIVNDTAPDEVESLSNEIETTMARYRGLCESNSFSEKDTPLHAAIRLQDYRYHETMQWYGHFANQANAQGQTPLDVAAEMASKHQTENSDIRANIVNTMKHLLHEGVTKTETYQNLNATFKFNPEHYTFDAAYPSRAGQAKTSVELKEVLRDIGEDHRYSLKMQKELAVTSVRQFVNSHQKNPQLEQIMRELKADLNGAGDRPPAPELQFIRQLRSQLWIVRVLRGLFGGTATKVEINVIINAELRRLTPGWSFFSASKPTQDSEVMPENPRLVDRLL